MSLDQKLTGLTAPEAQAGAVIGYLEEIEVRRIDDYAHKDAATLHSLYDQGIIEDGLVEDALEVAVIAQARSDYRLMTSNNKPYEIPADQLARPECLAYALNVGEFSQEEIERIPFNEYTSDSFVEKYHREDLPAHLREELFTPQEKTSLPPINDSYNPHLVCLEEY